MMSKSKCTSVISKSMMRKSPYTYSLKKIEIRKIVKELFNFQKLVKMWLFEVISPILLLLFSQLV
jgi:hypothetical protein